MGFRKQILCVAVGGIILRGETKFGTTMIHMVNGHVMSVVVDDDPARRKNDGLLGVQVHVGPPMKIEYRNFRLKKMVPKAGPRLRVIPPPGAENR